MTAIEKNIMKPKRSRKKRRTESEFEERVIDIARVSRVVKGGRRIRFRALVVIGNKKGKVGMGIATANEVADAIRKASSQAKKNLVVVPIIEGTIPHETRVKFGASKLLMKPAAPGTSIVAGGAVRAVVELAGISDVLAKILGSNNKINNVQAAIKALSTFNDDIVAELKKFTKESERVEIKRDNKEKEEVDKKDKKKDKKKATKKNSKQKSSNKKSSKKTTKKKSQKE